MCERLSRAFVGARPFLASSVLVAILFSAIDVATWPTLRHPGALVATLALGLANGAATALASWLLLFVPTRLTARVRSRARVIVPFVLVLAVTGLAGAQAMVVRKISSTAALLGLATASVGMSGIVSLGLASIARERPSIDRGLAIALAIVGGGILGLDRTLLAAVVEAPYSFVEAIAHVALAIAATRLLLQRRRLGTAVVVAGGLGLVSLGGSTSLRLAVERALPTLWEQPVYASRLTRRARVLESLASAGADGDRLARKYGLTPALGVDDAWHGGARGSARRAATSATPAPAPPPNVVVFFVDTLRADVAHDLAVMPGTVAWMQDSLAFTRVYSSGSSTLLTLAPMLGCRYDANPTDPPRLLDVAHAAGMQTSLVIARSAFDYHRVAYPAFRFDNETIVTDNHGRRHATASAIVDRSLDWLRSAKPERFLLWLYNYDVHSWNDLDDAYVENEAREGGFSKTDGIHWRYRAAARGVDRAFTRLRAGLEELGLADNTIVLFVSDHGEGLGDRNFWAHSTYLWESLLRVPLAMRIPGHAGRAVDVPVSTVDVAATLSRLLGDHGRTSDCHGVNLLDAHSEPRPLPILFSAMIDGRLARIGMLGTGGDRKLVFDLRDADARLLRISEGSHEEEDVSHVEPAQLSLRLGQLVRAPIYPRAN